MRRTLDPTLDIVFKLLFADSKNRDLLIALLTAVLRPKSPIRSVTVLNPEVSKEAVTDKSIVLDILVLCENGTQADVEMQADRRPAWRSRCMFYWAKVYSSQLTPGLPYTTLKPVKVVAFLGYQEFEGDWLHSVFQVQDTLTGKVFSDALELHTIELPKLAVMYEAERQENPALALWAKVLCCDDGRRIGTIGHGGSYDARSPYAFDGPVDARRSMAAGQGAGAVASDLPD